MAWRTSLVVRRFVSQADAGSGTAFDLVLQTGPGAVLEERILTLANAKTAFAGWLNVLRVAPALANGPK